VGARRGRARLLTVESTSDHQNNPRARTPGQRRKRHRHAVTGVPLTWARLLYNSSRILKSTSPHLRKEKFTSVYDKKYAMRETGLVARYASRGIEIRFQPHFPRESRETVKTGEAVSSDDEALLLLGRQLLLILDLFLFRAVVDASVL
jgi:hypothetical protein